MKREQSLLQKATATFLSVSRQLSTKMSSLFAVSYYWILFFQKQKVLI